MSETTVNLMTEGTTSMSMSRRTSEPQRPEDDNPRNDREMMSNFKRQLASGGEAQITLTNYKKGGLRFTNLLTVIPITWETTGGERRYYVGFQADRDAHFSNRDFISS